MKTAIIIVLVLISGAAKAQQDHLDAGIVRPPPSIQQPGDVAAGRVVWCEMPVLQCMRIRYIWSDGTIVVDL